MPTITEIIPKNMPAWFKQDMKDGQVFCRMVERSESFNITLQLLRRISESGLSQALNNLDSRNVDVYQHLLDEIERSKLQWKQ